MIELILALFIIPKTVSPAAKAAGRSGPGWSLIGIALFLAVELGTVIVYFISYDLLAISFQWQQKKAEHFWLTPVVYVLAIVCGLLSVDALRRYLSKKSLPVNNDVPPPPDFYNLR